MADSQRNPSTWLRDARLASGKSATAFAADLGVSRITLWRWESGKLEAPKWLRHAVSAARSEQEAANG